MCVTVRATESLHDPLIGILSTLKFTGFQQESDLFYCFVESSRWKSVKPAFAELLRKSSVEFSIPPIVWSEGPIEEKNWNKEWEAQAGAVQATSRIIIKPSWATLRKKDQKKIVIHIDPKMSFGTGHHETTRLSLSLLEHFVVAGDSVLDIGTGSGVLAIAAVKLGARRALGIDNDDWSIDNAKENVRRNRVERSVTVRRLNVDQLPEATFDIVIANIDFVTISTYVRAICRRAARGGILLLSGILTHDSAALRKLLPAGLKLIEQRTAGEWAGMAFRQA